MTPADLKKLRQDLGLTQSAMAEILGTTQSAISMMEAGERPITPRAEIILKIVAEHGIRIVQAVRG